jgi:hypothetical protein
MINSFALACASWTRDREMGDTLYKLSRSARMAMRLCHPCTGEILLDRSTEEPL